MRFALLLTASLAGPAAAAEPIGTCRFDPSRLSFAGSPVQQARCLLQLGDQPLPAPLQALLRRGGRPTDAHLARALTALPEPYASYARQQQDRPASRTATGAPLAYFVIHDTSWPRVDGEFPSALDGEPRINSFRYYVQAEPVAHVFVNRSGELWAAYDVAVPWRATKLESFVVGTTSRGRFYHVELVQPRRAWPNQTWVAPEPGFSAAQYRRLAALYVYASARSGRWLIPAFHSAIDAGIPEAHDDPQNFDLVAFARELQAIVYPQ